MWSPLGDLESGNSSTGEEGGVPGSDPREISETEGERDGVDNVPEAGDDAGDELECLGNPRHQGDP